MPSTATVTGEVGPGIALAAAVYQNVLEFSFLPNSVFKIVQGGPGVQQNIQYFDITDETTVTVTKSGANYTVTIS